ncbi:MAG: hypothetical protein NC932_03240 [Candidatus Omnitrophica bacterium]|nr:hypothetical protein [Candidatus Omnitrophota bacterium]
MIKTFEEKSKLLNYELYLLHTISKAIKETFNEKRILNITLTALTANGALGLSRAAIFYYDKEKNIVYGKKGIGPFDEKEAGQIWAELGKNQITLEEYLQHNLEEELASQKFPQLIKQVTLNLDELPETDYFKRVIVEKKFFHIKDINEFDNLPDKIKEFLTPSEIVIMPLFSSRDILGIIMADNAFHYNPIDESTEMLISLLSIQTGIALENAIYYNVVKQQYDELKELHSAMRAPTP